MRIVAGTYKGRRLAAPRGRDVRPTSDRVREAVFSILGEIEGMSVLDLFAGTGAMGLEALSRGAVDATFVEIDRQACDVVRRNIDATVSGDERVDLIRGDAIRVVRTLSMAGEAYDLVFFDPPYEQTEEMLRSSGDWLPTVCHAGTRIVLEVATRHANLLEVAVELWGAALLTAKKYGDTSVFVLRPTPRPALTEPETIDEGDADASLAE